MATFEKDLSLPLAIRLMQGKTIQLRRQDPQAYTAQRKRTVKTRSTMIHTPDTSDSHPADVSSTLTTLP